MVSNTPALPKDSSADRAAAEDGLPTITIIDNVEKKPVTRARNACGCLPERTVVIAILTCYFFLGIVRASAYFSSLAFTHPLFDEVLYTIFAIISLSFAIAAAAGMNAIYKEKAVLMRRLSIVFVILTFFIFVLNSTDFIVDIAARDDLRENCIQEVREYELNAENVNCDRVVNMYLAREGVTYFFFSLLQIYFAYVIFRHAREMTSQAKHPHPLVTSRNGDAPPTYFVYTSSGVPTAENWVPPPTYNGNPNRIRLAEDTKFASDAANRA